MCASIRKILIAGKLHAKYSNIRSYRAVVRWCLTAAVVRACVQFGYSARQSKGHPSHDFGFFLWKTQKSFGTGESGVEFRFGSPFLEVAAPKGGSESGLWRHPLKGCPDTNLGLPTASPRLQSHPDARLSAHQACFMALANLSGGRVFRTSSLVSQARRA